MADGPAVAGSGCCRIDGAELMDARRGRRAPHPRRVMLPESRANSATWYDLATRKGQLRGACPAAARTSNEATLAGATRQGRGPILCAS
jgi:hypothetical protein